MRTGTLARTVTSARDVDHFADIRSVEILRQVVRRDLRLCGNQRAQAREIGVNRNVVRQLISGQSTPSHESLQRLRNWAEDRPEVSIPMAQVGLALLVDDLPPHARGEARRRLAAVLAECYHGPTPDWIIEERGEALPNPKKDHACER